MSEKTITGYPSIDKPWLAFYEKALEEKDIPKCSAYHMLYENNRNYPDDIALIYFNGSITNFVGFRISDVILPAHIKQF